MPKNAGAVFIIGTKFCLRQQQPAAQPWHIGITLVRTITGIIEPPRLISAWKKDKITWGILNLGDRRHKVSLGSFAPVHPSVLKPAQPVSFPGGHKSMWVGPGEIGSIKAVVKSNASAGKYKYNIFIDGTLAVDPELEIEQPGTLHMP